MNKKPSFLTIDPRIEFAKTIYIYREINKETAEEHIKKQALLECLF